MRSGLLLLMLALPPVALGQERTPLPLPAAGNVTLPLDEYNRLLELAGKPVKEPPAPPQPYALESADLAFEVAGEKASGKILLEGEVFRAGATKVPLVAGLTILDAQQRGKDLPLQQEGGARIAVLSGPAAFSIALDTAFPLVIEAGRASFSLPVPAAGAVRLTLVVPGDHTSVNITPGLITGRASAAGRTTIQATLAPGQNTSIWWAARENVAPAVPKEVRFLSDIKTLVSVSELQLTAAALVDIQVVQGEPSQFEIEMPAGCELTGVTGAALESSEVQGGVLILKVTRPQLRSYQFLVSLEKPIDRPKTGAPLLRLKGAQRETGEILVEGEGTIELTAQEAGGLKRMDLRETTPFLRSMAHNSPQAAFRYHRQQSEPPALSLEWVRFPEGKLLAAVAQEAVVTTMVTPEGKSLTEVKLILRNRAQPFLKVALPAGAGIVSADVAGERVKPVQGPDGSRVPLLRPGFRPVDSYAVSFVFMHSGAPFARKGGAEIALPKMDLPIGILEWEIFLPERYKVADFGGDAIPANLLTPSSPDGAPAAYANPAATFDGNLLPGQAGRLGGRSDRRRGSRRANLGRTSRDWIYRARRRRLRGPLESRRHSVRPHPHHRGLPWLPAAGPRNRLRCGAPLALQLCAAGWLDIGVGRGYEQYGRDLAGIQARGRSGEEGCGRRTKRTLRQHRQPAAARGRRPADPGRGSARRKVVPLRAPAGDRRRDQGDLHLQDAITRGLTPRAYRLSSRLGSGLGN